jgi:hypothetical protein
MVVEYSDVLKKISIPETFSNNIVLICNTNSRIVLKVVKYTWMYTSTPSQIVTT